MLAAHLLLCSCMPRVAGGANFETHFGVPFFLFPVYSGFCFPHL